MPSNSPGDKRREKNRRKRRREEDRANWRAKRRAYYARNKATVIRRGMNRQKRLRDRGVLSVGVVGRLLQSQKFLCVACRGDLRKGYEMDHIMPIALGGMNEDWNVQLLCPRCNAVKNAQHPVAFMQSLGFLL